MRHHLARAKQIYRSQGLGRTVRTIASYIPIELNNIVFRVRYGSSTLVMEEDWDTLVLLDACRYDMFTDQIDVEGDLQSRISAGSTSEEFLERNFGSGTFHDTVYVNTNPYLPKLGLDDGTFHAVIDLLHEWDEDLQTVRPETVVDAAIDAHERFPNKRLIVHFMQPHIPFVGEVGRRIEAKGWDQEVAGLPGETVWQQLRRDDAELDEETVWEGYRENLDVVLSHLTSLLAELNDKTVISSDHGNMIGERLRGVPSKPKYGHFYGVYTPELVRVPWHVIETGDRRTVQSDPPVASEQQTEGIVEERLDALGYR